jgi:hypothetical protein
LRVFGESRTTSKLGIMKRRSLALAALLFIAAAGSPTQAKESSVISLDQLKQMFADMRANSGYKKWNVDGPLLWGYFFTDPDSKKLELVAEYLSSNGYRFVAIYPTDDKSTFFLHVEKAEHHTPESLNQRNLEFYKLASHFKLESYDGMDVGPVEK